MTFKSWLVCTTILSSISIISMPATSSANSVDELAKTIEMQQQQINALATALEQNPTSTLSNTSIGGYGEHHFNHNKKSDDIIDAHRYVLFVSHQYSDTIAFFSEFEIEHGLAGDGKAGEVEVEQAFIHWQINSNQALNIGQFLVPIGIINETHEPDTFYGVERNPVEAKIIPATWWEAGVMNSGIIIGGFSYDIALHSGLNSVTADIRQGRQKNSKAVAEKWAVTGRIKYTGIKGLELASTVNWQQDLTQGALTAEAEATLLELHGIYTTGPVGIRALYAIWNIDSDAAKTAGTDKQTGLYIEPFYKVSENLGIFARYSQWDNEAGSSLDTETTQYDIGLSYWLADNVVLKADWQDQDKASTSSEKDGFNLGVGWSF